MADILFPLLQPAAPPEKTDLPLYRETAWDFQNGKPVFRNGNPVIVTGKEAIQVWAWKALLTQRARYELYSWEFGCELESLIGQNYSEELKSAEAIRYVREALETNPYITGVDEIDVSFQDGRLLVSVSLDTVYGEVRFHV